MNYICITQQTASWLLTRAATLNKLHDILLEGSELQQLRHSDLVEGAFRLSGSPDGQIVAIWHADYLSGTGSEDWGFIRIASPHGLADRHDISREVFERAIYVINQRLQGLLLDSAFYHRTYANGAQTCMAGRGTVARHSSIGYVETEVQSGPTRSRSIICVGPGDNFEKLASGAADEARNLPVLVKIANDAIAPQRRRPVLNSTLFPSLRSEITVGTPEPRHALGDVTVSSLGTPVTRDVYRTKAWTYDDWVKEGSPLSGIQRRILEADGILKHPLRLMGPGGSGKTLLMQLLAVRRLRAALSENQPLSIIYIVHNAAMAESVQERFEILNAGEFLDGRPQKLRITTLSDFGKAELQLSDTGVIDVDAHETKLFQLGQVQDALKQVFKVSMDRVSESPLLSQVARSEDLFAVFSRLVMAEISTAIKGHGLTADKQRYVGSQRPLSRLHALLTLPDREIVFEAFQIYHRAVFEQLEVLDSDDIALSLMGKMRTPIWELKRRVLGYDFVFVDETQLFNENERRIFSLLSKGSRGYVPIVLALDEAQELYGQSSAGFGALGIDAIANESLPSSHRSTRAIVELAFFVIQQSTDLFGADFPDFTATTTVIEPSDHRFAAPPSVETFDGDKERFSKCVVESVQRLRDAQLRQIAVICHAEHHWEGIVTAFKASPLPVRILLKRGEPLAPSQPLVVLTRPAYVGGQEFDAVVVVGLEQGVVPPRIVENDALAAAVEQQAFREMYLSFTRARYQLHALISPGAKPTKVLQEAVAADLLQERTYTPL